MFTKATSAFAQHPRRPVGDPRIETHSDDASRLLAAQARWVEPGHAQRHRQALTYRVEAAERRP